MRFFSIFKINVVDIVAVVVVVVAFVSHTFFSFFVCFKRKPDQIKKKRRKKETKNKNKFVELKRIQFFCADVAAATLIKKKINFEIKFILQLLFKNICCMRSSFLFLFLFLFFEISKIIKCCTRKKG